MKEDINDNSSLFYDGLIMDSIDLVNYALNNEIDFSVTKDKKTLLELLIEKSSINSDYSDILESVLNSLKNKYYQQDNDAKIILESIFFSALSSDNINAIKAILEVIPSFSGQILTCGYNILHLAIASHKIEIAEYLIDHIHELLGTKSIDEKASYCIFAIENNLPEFALDLIKRYEQNNDQDGEVFNNEINLISNYLDNNSSEEADNFRVMWEQSMDSHYDPTPNMIQYYYSVI